MIECIIIGVNLDQEQNPRAYDLSCVIPPDRHREVLVCTQEYYGLLQRDYDEDLITIIAEQAQLQDNYTVIEIVQNYFRTRGY